MLTVGPATPLAAEAYVVVPSARPISCKDAATCGKLRELKKAYDAEAAARSTAMTPRL